MRRAREAGLTLVEMLVVLAIVGVMASVTLLAAGRGDRASSAESEARRLSVRLRLATDETMVTDRVLALAPDARGYSFVAWDATRRRWRPDAVETLGERHDLAHDITLAVVAGSPPLVVGPAGSNAGARLRFSGRGGNWTVQLDGSHVARSAPR